jgi:uncharacterized repeat protein (TIGR02543 family)
MHMALPGALGCTTEAVGVAVRAPAFSSLFSGARFTLSAVITAVAVVGCGGGGNTSTTTPTTPATGATTPVTSSTATTPVTPPVVVTTPQTQVVNYTLGVTTKVGGTVASAPSGISCAANSTCSASFASATPVTLTATAASGYTFTGWAGDCSGSGTCSVTMSAGKSVTANFTAIQPSTALITDKRLIPIPNAGTYPAKGSTTTDPITGFQITRVADKSELINDYGGTKSGMSLVVYSRFTALNTTGEYALVHGDNSTSAWIYRVSDNKMMTVVKFKPSLSASTGSSLGEVNELRWDYSGAHPYRLYFVGNSLPSSEAVGSEKVVMSFYYTDFDPATGKQLQPVLIHDFSKDFPTYTNNYIFNDVEGDSSNDSRYWAWMVQGSTSASGYRPSAIFVYDKQTDTVIGSIQRSCTGSLVPCKVVNSATTPAPYIPRPNMVEMSPLGTRAVVDWGRIAQGYGRDADINTVTDGPKAFLKDFSDPIRIGADETHSGWAWGPNGEEMFVSQNNRNDWIEAVNVATATTANCKLISGMTANDYTCGVQIYPYSELDGGSWSLGMHFGKVYDRTKKGYAFMNTYDTTYGSWGKNQNLFIEINDYNTRASKIVRFGSSYNLYYDYRSEGSGALDFQGNSIWTTGNWGFKDGRGDVFKIQLPANWFNAVP